MALSLLPETTSGVTVTDCCAGESLRDALLGPSSSVAIDRMRIIAVRTTRAENNMLNSLAFSAERPNSLLLLPFPLTLLSGSLLFIP
jgi:hypothetical protein